MTYSFQVSIIKILHFKHIINQPIIGLLSNFKSFAWFWFKISLIKCLIHSSFKLGNNWNSFRNDIENIKFNLIKNAYLPFLIDKVINPIQDGAGKKAPLPVFLQTLELPYKTFWLLVLTLLTDWCKIWSFYFVPVPNYWTWIKTTPQKKWFFWSNPYKIEVMITSLIQMLELPNFGHMTTSII